MRDLFFTILCAAMLALSAPVALFPNAKYEEWKRVGVNGELRVPDTGTTWKSRRGTKHFQYKAQLEDKVVLINMEFELPLGTTIPVIYDPTKLAAYISPDKAPWKFEGLILGSLSATPNELREINQDEAARYAGYVALGSLVGVVGFGFGAMRQLRRGPRIVDGDTR